MEDRGGREGKKIPINPPAGGGSEPFLSITTARRRPEGGSNELWLAKFYRRRNQENDLVTRLAFCFCQLTTDRVCSS